MDELYLDNIDEYVNDHNKIVTYKWLSLTLGVHVNTAKQMLFHYLDHKRKESSAQLHATYLVSGRSEDSGHKVSVVREEQLEDCKSKMSLVVSVHVYSVQKALLKDSGPLYSVDYDAVKDNLKSCSRFSAIRCAGAAPRSTAELQQAREQQQQRPPTPEPEPRPAAAAGTNGHAKPPAKQQKGIMGMFGNKAAAPKKEAKVEMKEEKEEAAPVDVPKSKVAAKTNPMMHFFGNQTTKKPDKVKQEEPAPAPSSSSAPAPAPTLQPEKKQEAPAAPPAREKKKDSRSKTKRTEDSDGEDEKMEKKKRRRIKKPEPDSSDEDVIPDSPQHLEPQQVPPSPTKEEEPVPHSHQGSSDAKIRKRRRVLKSRTFIDDEGCIVTEKGYESESYSEAEDDVPPPPKHAAKAPARAAASSRDEEKKSQKKAAAGANKGTKQASIMGFFQKK